MSSSEEDASLEEEKWDDMAVVRAFEDAMQGKRGDKKAAYTENNGKQRSRKEPSTRKQVVESMRTAAAPHQWNAPDTESARGANLHQSTAHAQSIHAQSPEEIYQAAYVQAYAHLQAQWQPQQHYHHQPASTPSYPQHHGGYGFPSQWTPGVPAGMGMAAPSPPVMPFPSAPGSMPPAFASSAGAQDDLANLLMSWYQSGYYTGRYQAMQEVRTKGPR